MTPKLANNICLAILSAAIVTACASTPLPVDASVAGPPRVVAPVASAAPAKGPCESAGGFCVSAVAMVACKSKGPAACGPDEICCLQ